MKFGFSTISCPKWDFETIAARAREYGYHGVEVRGFLHESILTNANVFLTDPHKVRAIFDAQGIQVCCLSSSIAMTGDKRRDAALAADARTYIDLAGLLGCPMVKVFDTQVRPGGLFRKGQTREAAGIALGNWLLPLGDYAAERGVTIVVENGLSFRSAKELWLILDRISHPAVGVCWDVFNAALIGEHPSISVPTLNSRIVYTQVRDATLGPLGATYRKLGDGDVAVRRFVTRLLGIGYTGYVTVEWEKAWLPGLAEPEEILPDALTKLKEWSAVQADDPAAEGDSEPAAAGHEAHDSPGAVAV
jgi:sugar phosphate isomerase/epimerase